MSTVQIAILGAGPSGCYAAQFLQRSLFNVKVTLIDKLPVPYGLIRYGVAPDHIGTKQIVHQFARQIERGNIDFLGNVQIPHAVPFDVLEENYHLLICATGLSEDRCLEIRGENLSGVWGSGVFTRYINDHPFYSHMSLNCGHEVAIIGNGNVAIDLLRLLAKSSEDFSGSELSETALTALNSDAVRTIHLIGRSGPCDAKFDTVMLKELQQLKNVRFEFAQKETEIFLSQNKDNPLSIELSRLITQSPEKAQKKVVFHFHRRAKEFIGKESVAEVILIDNLRESTEEVRLPVDTVITAIGYQHREDDISLCIDDLSIPVFKVGWCATGPRGKIPYGRQQARVLLKEVEQALSSVQLKQKNGLEGILTFLDSQERDYVDYSDWLKIDEQEVATAPVGRVRKKLRTIEEMLEVAKIKVRS